MSPAPRAAAPRTWSRLAVVGLALAGLLGLADRAPGQQPGPQPGQEQMGGLTLHHTAPRAGATLTLVIQGGVPGETVWLELFEATSGPPSLLEFLSDSAFVLPGEHELVTPWFADERGLVVLNIELDDPDDADKPIFLRARTETAFSERLHLHVHPPQLVIEAGGVLQRIDLRDGRRLEPAITGRGGLAGLALSADGLEGYLLRAGGWLEVRHGARWNTRLRAPIAVDDATDGLAASAEGGPAFLLARPGGEPFAAGGRLTFLDGSAARLGLGPMGQEVTGHRWALTDDGLNAFVAEDDLVVREVDLLGHGSRGVFVAGLVGDAAITDLLLVGRTLVVATRRLPGLQGGTLTWYDLDTGTLRLADLDVTPRRLVALDPTAGAGELLVVPEDERFLQRVVAGVPQAPQAAGALAEDGSTSVWVDAAAVPGGALLLRRDADGTHALEKLGPDGILRTLVASAPAATRVITAAGVTASAGLALLVGDPSGLVYRVELGADGDVLPGRLGSRVTPVEGVATQPSAAFVVLD